MRWPVSFPASSVFLLISHVLAGNDTLASADGGHLIADLGMMETDRV
jgi:hypothetical protein